MAATPQQMRFRNTFPPLISLQELLKEPIISVPEPYVQLQQEIPVIDADQLGDPLAVPVIDVSKLSNIEGSCRESELEKLHSACKDWGIFLAVNHGVGASLQEKLKHEVEEFFKLPLEEKMKYQLKPGDFQGYGQTLIALDGKKLDWADRFYMVTSPTHMRKPHLIPQLSPSLRDALEAYMIDLQDLARKLVLSIARSLGIEEKEMMEMFEDGMQSIRMTYYPPCPKPELVMGLKPHSDGSLITFVLQVNGVEGLQVKKDGTWIPVNFMPDSFVVNLGDILEILSNGLYKSCEHRATVNAIKERISFAMFFNPKLEAEVGPSRSLLSLQNPPLFRRVGMQKYVEDFFARRLDGKSYLEVLRLKEGEAI
ncbi:Oxoglutarate-dependent flavonoid 7-O-demethylase 1-like protein [Drosera capensis]